MKLPKVFQKKEKKRVFDFYQNSIDKIGKDQFKMIIKRGINVPVVL